MQTTSHIEISYHPVRLEAVPGKTSTVEEALPLLFEKVEGITVLNTGGRHGVGILTLSIGGEEIFPEGFHARAFMYHQVNDHRESIVAKDMESYLWEVDEKAEGATVKVSYTEAQDGAKGHVYLLLKLTKQVL